MRKAIVKTTRNSRLWIGLALACVAFAAPCSACGQVSLRSVVELAQQNAASVRMAQHYVQRAAEQATQVRDAFIPSISFGSGLPAFPQVGFTGSLPSIWGSKVQSLVFSMPQIRQIQAARAAVEAAQSALRDAREQVTLDVSTAYIELDMVNSELEAARAQQHCAEQLIAIEQQRTDAGVDSLSMLLQARLTAAQLRLNRLRLEKRAATLSKQLAAFTGLPLGSIVPDHSSIPQVPAISAARTSIVTPCVMSSQQHARSRVLVAMGDSENRWFLPEISFGLNYNRYTTLLNSVQDYFNPKVHLPPNNLSSGLSISVPLFDRVLRDKAKRSAAEALLATVEAEQAQRQNEVQIVRISSSLRVLEAEAEVANLKQQIAGNRLKAVITQLEFGNGEGAGPGAPPQLPPQAEQDARIDERQKYEDVLDAEFDLNRARLDLLRVLGHMQDWLDELRMK